MKFKAFLAAAATILSSLAFAAPPQAKSRAEAWVNQQSGYFGDQGGRHLSQSHSCN